MYQANIRDLITKLPQSNKTEHFLMNKFSNQDKVQQLQRQISQQLINNIMSFWLMKS